MDTLKVIPFVNMDNSFRANLIEAVMHHPHLLTARLLAKGNIEEVRHAYGVFWWVNLNRYRANEFRNNEELLRVYK